MPGEWLPEVRGLLRSGAAIVVPRRVRARARRAGAPIGGRPARRSRPNLERGARGTRKARGRRADGERRRRRIARERPGVAHLHALCLTYGLEKDFLSISGRLTVFVSGRALHVYEFASVQRRNGRRV
jgi:hypothetical protein